MQQWLSLLDSSLLSRWLSRSAEWWRLETQLKQSWWWWWWWEGWERSRCSCSKKTGDLPSSSFLLDAAEEREHGFQRLLGGREWKLFAWAKRERMRRLSLFLWKKEGGRLNALTTPNQIWIDIFFLAASPTRSPFASLSCPSLAPIPRYKHWYSDIGDGISWKKIPKKFLGQKNGSKKFKKI